MLIEPSNIDFVLNKCNSFDNNLIFTVGTFPDGFVHFLDLKICESGIDVFRKSLHTGQYTHFSSFEPWGRKTAWSNHFSLEPKRFAPIPIILATRFLKLIFSYHGTAFLLPYKKHSPTTSKENIFRIQILLPNQPMTVYPKFGFAYHS